MVQNALVTDHFLLPQAHVRNNFVVFHGCTEEFIKVVQGVQGIEKKLPGLPQDKDDHRTPVPLKETEARRVGPRYQEKWKPGPWGPFSQTFL